MRYLLILVMLVGCTCEYIPEPPTQKVVFSDGTTQSYHLKTHRGVKRTRLVRFNNLELDCRGDSNYTSITDTIVNDEDIRNL